MGLFDNKEALAINVMNKLVASKLADKFSAVYGIQCSLPRSQQPTTVPYSEPTEPSLYLHTVLPVKSILIISTSSSCVCQAHIICHF